MLANVRLVPPAVIKALKVIFGQSDALDGVLNSVAPMLNVDMAGALVAN